MSRIGKKPIKIPAGVQVGIEGCSLKVKGPKGELQREFDPRVSITVSDGTVMVSRATDSKFLKALHGLSRSLINNMIIGVTRGFEKKLEVVGVGFKAEMKNKRLMLQVGYSHPIIFVPPPEINITCDSPNMISVSGIDKELVGQIAAKIRDFRPPEPYKGKGIKYLDEVIRRKAGKAAGS
ncbi:MAG: 50S ribosomal protein L6 [candidate division KSB1 bacterium]|nr:50S ribosomal protein L6 [candidate division KSB1 bacterium]MDZ7301363.1 50S ribosomal protein L6 [candidate division KSB1 bacterium]MDZ7310752.1 50S ribosomal protein L6 [candidate division KSB1 bacterium]